VGKELVWYGGRLVLIGLLMWRHRRCPTCRRTAGAGCVTLILRHSAAFGFPLGIVWRWAAAQSFRVRSLCVLYVELIRGVP